MKFRVSLGPISIEVGFDPVVDEPALDVGAAVQDAINAANRADQAASRAEAAALKVESKK